MIAEDERDNREIMQTVVEDLLGHEALLASNGKEALRIASDRMPDLILMDLMMPVLDGFETIRRLPSDAKPVNIPVIAVTALSRPMDRRLAVECGADDYVSKPFDLDLMISMIQQYIASGCTARSHDNMVGSSSEIEADHSTTA